MKKELEENNRELQDSPMTGFLGDSSNAVTTVLANPVSFSSPEAFVTAVGAGIASLAGARVQRLVESIRNDPKVDPEKLKSETAQQSLIELAEFAVKENPKSEVWEAAQKIYKKSLYLEEEVKNSASFLDMIEVVKKLSQSEILILSAAKRYVLANDESRDNNYWSERISKMINFSSKEQVIRYQENLVELKLLAGSVQGNPSAWHIPFAANKTTRLTTFGWALCEALEDSE